MDRPQAPPDGGIGFVNCDAAPPGGAAHASRRPVVINGRRIKTIDMHAHCTIAETAHMAGKNQPFTPKSGIVVPAQRLAEMDQQGVDVEALSVNPFWYEAERDVAAEIVRINNDKLAELCGAHPDRFAAFATVALQYSDLAVAQLEHAVRRLGLRGVAVGASVGEREFSNAEFHPFWAKCEELGALVFIHPSPMSDMKRLRGNGSLYSVIGNPLDTTIALSHLIFEGTLDRFPGLRICAAHGGGYLPSYIGRAENCLRAFSDRMDPKIVLKKGVRDYLQAMYFDSLLFTAEGLRHLVAEVGASQVVMGSDHPFGWTTAQVDHILDTPTLTDDERIAILGGTAARLLGIEMFQSAAAPVPAR